MGGSEGRIEGFVVKVFIASRVSEPARFGAAPAPAPVTITLLPRLQRFKKLAPVSLY